MADIRPKDLPSITAVVPADRVLVDGATTRSIAISDLLDRDIRQYGAKGDGVTDDGPAIRLAVAATPKGGKLRIPYGKWYCNSVGTDGSVFGLAADTVISIIGDGWSLKKDGSYASPTGSIIALGPDIPDTGDVIRFFGTDVNFGSTLRDFAIIPSDSTYGTAVGRHGVFVDGVGAINFYQSNMIVDHVFIDNMKTGYSFKSTADSGSNTGALAFSSIGGKSQLMCVDLAYVGDGVKVGDCVLGFNSTDGARDIGVRFNNVSGAAGTQVVGNVIANRYKQVVADGGVKPVIRDNEFELGNLTSGGGVLIDINGANSIVYSPTITGNTISQNSTVANYVPIRVDNAQAADIYDNRIAIPSAANHIVITSNAGATHVGPNYYTIGGTIQVDGTISNSGTLTRIDGRLATTYPGTTSGTTAIQASAAAGGTLTLPAATDTLVGKATTDTLTNKTLTAPVINSPAGITKANVGLANVDNTSDANKPVSTAQAAADATKAATVKIKKFTASGTYTPSTGLLYAVIECVGPGGAGGGTTGAGTDLKAGGGGGSGGYSRTVVSAATVGASKAVTVGTGGAGATNAAGAAGSGQTSVGTLCVANPGSGGALNNGSSAFGAGGAGGVVWAGAGANDIAVTGAAGAYGPLFFTPANAPTLVLGGGGGPSFFGGGAPGPAQSSGNAGAGTNATVPGSGGSGGISYTVATNTAGGAGADGYVIITEFVNQ